MDGVVKGVLVLRSQTLFLRMGDIVFSISVLLEKGSGRVYSTYSEEGGYAHVHIYYILFKIFHVNS